jgi:gas vesicle protein
MNDEKLDLILTTVSGLNLKIDDLSQRVNKLEKQNVEFRKEIRQDISEFRNEMRSEMSEFRNEVRQDINELRSEVRQIGKKTHEEFVEIKKIVKALSQRVNLIEKQIISIAMELKEEIKIEIQKITQKINILESDTLFARQDSLENRKHIIEIENRLLQVERI